jgi:SAM-dependent methyltransferase
VTATQAGERALRSLYDDLARYQWWRRRFARAAPGEGLEMHKRLSAPSGDGPGAGTSGLHEWLWDRLRPAPGSRALDVGCGFGATLFSLAARVPELRFLGVSLSPYQVRIADREAHRLGLATRGSFRVQSFDDPLGDEPYDLVLSIESLFHSPDLAATLDHLARHLAPEGRLVLVEDVATSADAARSPDGRELLRTWSTRHLYTLEDYRRAIEGAGLLVVDEVDLSAQVPRREPARLDESARRLRRWRGLAPTAGLRRMVDAFLGGVSLERLYEGGRMSYRVLVARP